MSKVKNDESKLDEEIKELIEDLKISRKSPDDYLHLTSSLVKLYEAKEIECSINSKNSFKIDYNNLIMIAGNLAGILLILNYEKFDAITSKALTMIVKPKI